MSHVRRVSRPGDQGRNGQSLIGLVKDRETVPAVSVKIDGVAQAVEYVLSWSNVTIRGFSEVICASSR